MLCEFRIEHVIIASVTEDRGLALGRDGAQLDVHAVRRILLPVLQTVAVSSGAVVIFPTTSEMAAGHAEPQIRTQLTFAALGVPHVGSDLGGTALIEHESVLTGLDFVFPFSNCALRIG